MLTQAYIYKKSVDWSLFKDGFNIPVSLQVLFYESVGRFLKKGESKKVRLLLDGVYYDALLVNIAFDEAKYPGHKELLQIRYSYNSPIARRLQSIFHESYEFVLREKAAQVNKRAHIRMPAGLKEFLTVYTTGADDVFYVEAVTNGDYKVMESEIRLVSEDVFEAYSNYSRKDADASVVEMEKLVKIRRLDRSIADTLKALYDYRCQVTGEKFGDRFGAELSEAHHIDYFTKSLNNDSDNIVILSPNYHRLIHKAKPVFDRKQLAFIFPNGLAERLVLNKHL